ncbi:MAG: hypothetical protein ABFS30_01880 [Pseudomonadota bacterium]
MSKVTSKMDNGATNGYTIGRHAFAKISEVEDIRLTAEMDEDFREFERQGLSAEQRRKALASKYGTAR